MASAEEAEPRWLTDEEQQAWRATLHTHMLLLRQLDIDLRADGLSRHDYEILVVLSEAPGQRMRMTELADATSQTRSRLSHQVSRMEARDLLRREEYAGDKRGMMAVLTQTGMDTIVRVAPHHVESVRRHFIDHLSPDQLEDIRIIFQPIADYLRKIRPRDLPGLLAGSPYCHGRHPRARKAPHRHGSGPQVANALTRPPPRRRSPNPLTPAGWVVCGGMRVRS